MDFQNIFWVNFIFLEEIREIVINLRFEPMPCEFPLCYSDKQIETKLIFS